MTSANGSIIIDELGIQGGGRGNGAVYVEEFNKAEENKILLLCIFMK
jgi:hypothetical protein